LLSNLDEAIMACKSIKSEKSKYQFVRKLIVNDKVYWSLTFRDVSKKGYKTEREAAIAADKILIKKGKEPVNILVRK